jgi:hypothetical protein
VSVPGLLLDSAAVGIEVCGKGDRLTLYGRLSAGERRGDRRGGLPRPGGILEAAGELQGLERLEQIKFAVLERSGKISIIPKGPGSPGSGLG